MVVSGGIGKRVLRELRGRYTGRNFRLQPKLIPIQHVGLLQSLAVKQLGAGAAVMQFITHQLTVRAVKRQIHSLDQYDQNSIYRHVVRRFNCVDAASRYVANLDFEHSHKVRYRLAFPISISTTKLATRIAFQMMAIHSGGGFEPFVRLAVMPNDKPAMAGPRTKINRTHPSAARSALVRASPLNAPLTTQVMPTVDHAASTYDEIMNFFRRELSPSSVLDTHIGQK
jgi:hypothetical protein